MKFTKQIYLLGFILVLFSSCAKIFSTPDAYSLAQKQKTIAIIAPVISIAANKKIDAEAMKEQQKTESINFQKEIYAWMLRRKMQGKITQEIQETETTNAKLKKAGYPETPLTSAEICGVLGVDGIMTSNFGLSKPMSEGAALVGLFFFGFNGATNQIYASISINDCGGKKLIWNYNHKVSGGIGSSVSSTVDGLMRHASRKMPYVR